MLRETGAEVLIIDPTYLAMPGDNAGNVFSQGEKLARINKLCEEYNVGLILVHHTTKGSDRQNKHKPPELDGLAWSGFAEWARQWLLIARRESYEDGTGHHELWLNVGGSAGHSSRWVLEIEEGAFGNRHWEVTVSLPGEVEEKEKVRSIRDKVLAGVKKFPDGNTKNTIAKAGKFKLTKQASAEFEALVKDKMLVRKQIKKGNVAYPGFALAG